MLNGYGVQTINLLSRRKKSFNVISVVRPKGKAAGRIVIAANHDSPYSGFIYSSSTVWSLRFVIIADFLISCALFMIYAGTSIATLLQMEPEIANTLKSFSLFALLAYIPISISLIALALSKPSPGANCNASGLSVLLELHKRYHKRLPRQSEIWFVSCAGTNASASGMRAFVKKYSKETKKAAFIVVENCGQGRPVIVKGEGLMPMPLKSPRKIVKTVGKALKGYRTWNISFITNRYYCGNLSYLLLKRRNAIEVSARKSKMGPPGSWRQKQDTAESIDFETINKTCELVFNITEYIDREAAYSKRFNSGRSKETKQHRSNSNRAVFDKSEYETDPTSNDIDSSEE